MGSRLKRPVVLVVEDEPLLLMSAMDIAEVAGFEALPAPDADRAIAILESRNDIQIIFTDVDMPGSMDGVRLAHATRGRWPPVKIVVTSGRPLASFGALPVGSHFLPKPYIPDVVSKLFLELKAA